MSKHDGGPAFPVPQDSPDIARDVALPSSPRTGMTLRDWLAGQVVQECLNQYGAFDSAGVRKSVGQAYSIADAMLAERDK